MAKIQRMGEGRDKKTTSLCIGEVNKKKKWNEACGVTLGQYQGK